VEDESEHGELRGGFGQVWIFGDEVAAKTEKAYTQDLEKKMVCFETEVSSGSTSSGILSHRESLL